MNRRLFLGALAGGMAASGAQAQAPNAPAAEPLEQLWSRPLPNVIALALAADGSRLLAGDLDGNIRCYNPAGALLWSVTCAGVNRILCSDGGRLTLAYAHRRPLVREVYFLDADGARVSTLAAGTAVSAAAISADGDTAAFAAGKLLTFCSRDRSGMRTRTVPLPAEPFQLQMGPADTVYVAYRQPGRVDLMKSSGRVLWSHTIPPTGTVGCISASADGKSLAVATHSENDLVEVTLLDWQHNRQWTETRAGRVPRVRICANGSAVLLTYEHKVEHGEQKLFERRLAYLAGPSGGTWTKGGGYTAPLLVSCSADGSWVVALDRQRELGPARFRLYGRDGGRLWIYPTAASVLIATPSLQGRDFAVYRTDGTLEMVHVTPR